MEGLLLVDVGGQGSENGVAESNFGERRNGEKGRGLGMGV